MEGHNPYGALARRAYRFLLAGAVLSGIGAEIQAVAVGWEIYLRTKSPLLLGYAGLAQFLPVLLLSLPAGHLVDRCSRKGLLIAAQTGMTLISVGLAVLSWLEGPVPLIFLCLLLAGCCRALNMPARAALLPQVVPPELLANAVTWNSSGWQIANLTGPALGGLALALSDYPPAGPGDEGLASFPLGPVIAYLLAGLCTLNCVVLFSLICPMPVTRAVEPRSLTSVLAGLRFVWRTKLLLAACTLDLFAVLFGGATALLPIFARDILDVGPTGLGYLRAAPAAGAFVMALLLAHRPPLRRTGLALLLAVAGFGLATIAFGLSENFVLSTVLLALTGALDNISVVIRATMLQLLTPNEMKGRVAAVNAIFIASSNELGAFESGLTAAWFGTVPSVVLGGAGTLVVILIAMAAWPELLRLGPLTSLKQNDEE